MTAGRSGRFQKERLHLSPFVYRQKGLRKVYNPDFQAHGHYRDPIYGNFYIKGCHHPIPQIEPHPIAQEVSFADYMNGGEEAPLIPNCAALSPLAALREGPTRRFCVDTCSLPG